MHICTLVGMYKTTHVSGKAYRSCGHVSVVPFNVISGILLVEHSLGYGVFEADHWK